MFHKHLFRLFRFVGVGCVSTVVYTVIYILLQETVRQSVFVTTVIAYCCAMLSSFLGHKHLTFRAKGNTPVQLLRYVFVYAVGLIFAYLIMDICIQHYQLHYLLGIIAVDVALPLLSFVVMLVFIFPDRASHRKA